MKAHVYEDTGYKFLHLSSLKPTFIQSTCVKIDEKVLDVIERIEAVFLKTQDYLEALVEEAKNGKEDKE